MAGVKKTFYRRVLPEVCIDFASEKGRHLFKEALLTGYMNCYFPLASQFRTQEEPAYCGLSSLVMVLNALAVDPGQVWKGVFRWYHEDMLDCCIPLEEIKKKGVSMDSLLCLATCNQLNGELTRVKETLCVEGFREEIKDYTSKDDRAMIISYGRNVLGQTGSGHFSPVGGYNEKEDMVLIMDVARFKYPPYWVPLEQVWKAMMSFDTETGLPRGYMKLWRADNKGILSQPPLLFRISKTMNAFKPMLNEVNGFLSKAKAFLYECVEEKSTEDILKKIVFTLLQDSFSMIEDKHDQDEDPNFLSLRITESQLQDLFQDQADAVQQLISAIQSTELYNILTGIVPAGVCCRQSLFQLQNKTGPNADSCDESSVKIGEEQCVVCLPHFLTIFLLSFPVNNLKCCKTKCSKRKVDGTIVEDGEKKMSYASFLKEYICTQLYEDGPKYNMSKSEENTGRELLINEVTQLCRQFVALLSVHEQKAEVGL